MLNEFGSSPCQNDRGLIQKSNDENCENWRLSPKRRSVHEMIKRFQQVSGLHNGWKGQRSGSSEPVSPDHSQCLQNQRVQPQGGLTNGWHGESGGVYHLYLLNSVYIKNH